VGINLGLDAPSSEVVALALYHAILPKHYGQEYKLSCGGNLASEHLFTDGGRDFRSNHLKSNCSSTWICLPPADRPSEGGIVERRYSTQISSRLYQGTPDQMYRNVQSQPKKRSKAALRELGSSWCVTSLTTTTSVLMPGWEIRRSFNSDAGLRGGPSLIRNGIWTFVDEASKTPHSKRATCNLKT